MADQRLKLEDEDIDLIPVHFRPVNAGIDLIPVRLRPVNAGIDLIPIHPLDTLDTIRWVGLALLIN